MSTVLSSVMGTRHDGWLQPLGDWVATVIRSLQREASVVRVVVASVRGSAPREPGTCMVVESAQTFGTIGGGRLEWAAIEFARRLILHPDLPGASVARLVLGTELAQCCGGVVELWIERFTRPDLPLLSEAVRATKSGPASLVSEIHQGCVSRRVIRQFAPAHPRITFNKGPDGGESLHERLGSHMPTLWLYGAGHVGQALARILAEMPLQVTWVDSRAELLPISPADHVDVRCVADPVATVAEAPPNTCFLVMTHSHPLDYALCRAILRRNAFAWAGVIGSRSKAARFRSRLTADGVAAESIDRLTCPIGVRGIASKEPGVIAVAIAAQLLQVLDARAARAQVEPVTHTACNGECTDCNRSMT